MDCKNHRPFQPLLNLLLCLFIPAGGFAAVATTADITTLLQQAESAYRSGNLEAAASAWTAAAGAHHELGDATAESRALMQAAAASQGLGHYTAAIQQLEQARALAAGSNDPGLQAVMLNRLGSAYVALHDFSSAEPLLNAALQQARARQDQGLEASVLGSLGNLEHGKGNDHAALEHYSRSLQHTTTADETARAATSAAALSLAGGDLAGADGYIQKARAAAGLLPDSHDKAYLLIRIARMQQQLAKQSPAHHATMVRAAWNNLQEASRIAAEINDPRARSWTAGYLGELYASQGRIDEAMALTRRAVYAIQGLHAQELLFRWEWQQGRLLKAQGDDKKALKSYSDAIRTLHTVRAELAASLEHSRESYHQLVGPLYLEYADLLLQEGETAADPAEVQRKLAEARDAVELLKTVELQDYFQDDCVSLARARIKGLDETLSSHTAVIYPILFPDRTELLLSTRDGLSRHSVPVTAAELTAEVHDFRSKLEKRTTRQYLRPAQRLYDWLIRPIETELAGRDIDTLVIVPDAALRTVPMAALHDGKHYLVHKYALASTPSLELTDPRPIRAQNIDLLMNGLTEPVQGFPGLPNVAAELQEIQSLHGGRILANRDFSIDGFREQLAGHPYSIVHIASHGKFEGKVSDSFILAYDGKLSMNDLEQHIGLSQLRVDQPLELLTLSACQTAVGDDWAGLGLASIAIKAGARSALATLWYVNDQVTSELITGFYRRLGEPDTTKAQALQQAQLDILGDLRYQHPAYWAPYLLIGNWL